VPRAQGVSHAGLERVREPLILPYDLAEDLYHHHLLQGRADHVQELGELILLILGALRSYDEFSDVLLIRRVDAERFHRSIGVVNLLLKHLRFSALGLYQNCHLSEYVRVDDCTEDQCNVYYQQLQVSARPHLVASKEQNRIIDRIPVLQARLLLVDLSAVKNEVERRDPQLLEGRDPEPEAPKYMNKDGEQED